MWSSALLARVKVEHPVVSTAAVDLKAGKRGRNLGGGGRRESGALNPRPKAEEVVLAPFGSLGEV